MFEIYHADCLQVLRTLPDQCADAIIMDPPYSNQSPSRGKSRKVRTLAAANPFGAIQQHGLDLLLSEVARQSRRLVKPQGSMLCFCDHSMLLHLVQVLELCSLKYVELVVWDKGHFGTGRGFRKRHELIAHFSYGQPRYHDSSTSNVIHARRVADRRHQTEKPLDLLAKLIKVVCPAGGTVLDPFMGVGSTGLACLSEGRNFIGVEVHRGHFDIADRELRQLEARIAAGHSQASTDQPAVLPLSACVPAPSQVADGHHGEDPQPGTSTSVECRASIRRRLQEMCQVRPGAGAFATAQPQQATQACPPAGGNGAAPVPPGQELTAYQL